MAICLVTVKHIAPVITKYILPEGETAMAYVAIHSLYLNKASYYLLGQ
jgi:hypothetical protein